MLELLELLLDDDSLDDDDFSEEDDEDLLDDDFFDEEDFLLIFCKSSAVTIYVVIVPIVTSFQTLALTFILYVPLSSSYHLSYFSVCADVTAESHAF